MLNKKIFVACPHNVATGGPELMHQLVHTLRCNNFNAFIFYYLLEDDNDTITSPVHSEYLLYNIEYVTSIEDEENNILVAPEIDTKLLKNYKNVYKFIWWLSVDNYFKYIDARFKYYKTDTAIKFAFKRFLNALVSKSYGDFLFSDSSINHMSQSIYASEFLKDKGIAENKIYYLSDYLNKDFIDSAGEYNNKNKKNIVVYNPKKGLQITNNLIDYCNVNNLKIAFAPIQNMTRDEVVSLLGSSKVYIDFGNHPGKDRIPREAAILGNVIITNKEGSANFVEDTPFPQNYKFKSPEENFKEISNLILRTFDNFEAEQSNFSNYQNFIIGEQEKFENDVKSIFSSNF